MYPFMTLPVHFQTFIMITVKIYPSTFLLFYMSTYVPVHHYTCSVYFLFFGITCTMSFRLVYWGTYRHIHPKRNVPVYPHAFLWSNNQYLHVSTTTSVPAHRCTRSWPYLFIAIQSFWFPLSSTRPRFCCSTFPHLPVYQYICSVYFLFFSISYAMTFQLIYWGTYPQIHQKINVPVYPHASLSSNHKDLPVTTTISIPSKSCTRSWPYLFIFIHSFRLTV